MSAEVRAPSTGQASLRAISLFHFNSDFLKNLRCSCWGVCVLKCMSDLCCPTPVLTADRVKMELVLAHGAATLGKGGCCVSPSVASSPLSGAASSRTGHGSKVSGRRVGRQQLFLSSAFSLLMDL